MIERMEIAESIYEGVVEPSYKKLTWADANPAGKIRYKRVEFALSWTRLEKGKSAGKRRKQHVDISTGKLKNCLIHGPGILQKNVRSWKNLGLSMLIVDLLRTAGATQYQGNFLTGKWKTMSLLTKQ